MKITFLHREGHGGLSGGFRVITDYAEALQRSGHEVTLISPEVLSPRFRTGPLRHLGLMEPRKVYKDYLHGRTFKTIVLNYASTPKPQDIPDADILICTWWETLGWAENLPASKGKQVHFIQHYEPEHYPEGSEQRARAQELHNRDIPRIVIADWIRDKLQNDHNSTQIRMIYNGVDPDLFHAPPRGKQEQPTIGFMSARAPRKKLREASDLIKELQSQQPELRCVSFGAIDPEAAFKHLPEGSKFQSRPPQQEIRELYASCDVWLTPSEFEGFHLPPLEAMACRTPVVATRIGGAVEVIEHGRNGFLTDINDFDALGAHLLKVVSMSESEWKAMSDAAFATAQANSWATQRIEFEKALIAAKDGSF